MTWLLKIGGVLKRIPWPIYAAAIVLAAWWLDRSAQYRSGYSEGRESVLAELRTAEATAKDKALKAIAEAGEAGIERAERFEQQQETLRQAIQEAEKANRNALDELF